MYAECGFTLFVVKRMDVPGKDVVLNVSELLCINTVITEDEMSFAKGTDTSPYHPEKSLDVPFASGAHSLYFFQQRSGTLIGLTTMYVSTV